MDNHFVCCDQCFEIIGNRSRKAARVWLDLCGLRLQRGEVFSLFMQDFPELRVLETLGYITTTDKPFEILVRLHGLKMLEDGVPFFCTSEVPHGNT